MNGEDKILNEKTDTAKNFEKACSRASLFYQHAAKFKHNPIKQSTTWVDDIREHSNATREYLDTLSPKQINAELSKLKNGMQGIYDNGIKGAINEGNRQCKGQTDIFEEFPTFDDITDKTKVESFIKEYAYTQEVKDYINPKKYDKWSVYSILNKK